MWEPLKHAAGEATTKLKEVKVDQDNTGAENKDAGQAGQALNNWLTGRSTGDILHLEARITPKSSTDGFAQVLRFPLRFVEKDVLPLPLAPAFIHFEDPEYNRLLATLRRLHPPSWPRWLTAPRGFTQSRLPPTGGDTMLITCSICATIGMMSAEMWPPSFPWIV